MYNNQGTWWQNGFKLGDYLKRSNQKFEINVFDVSKRTAAGAYLEPAHPLQRSVFSPFAHELTLLCVMRWVIYTSVNVYCSYGCLGCVKLDIRYHTFIHINKAYNAMYINLCLMEPLINTPRPRQNGRHFADDDFKSETKWSPFCIGQFLIQWAIFWMKMSWLRIKFHHMSLWVHLKTSQY